MPEITDKLLAADGIIIASPVYFLDVTARMKTFIDRTRPLHMMGNQLRGKVAAAIGSTGVADSGGSQTMDYMYRWISLLEMHPIFAHYDASNPRAYVLACQYAGTDPETHQAKWTRIQDDEETHELARTLAKDMYAAMVKLAD